MISLYGRGLSSQCTGSSCTTRLAQDLHRRPELYETYLVELLTLFADKGVAIQNLKIANHQSTVR